MVELDLSKLKCHWCGAVDSFKCVCGYRTCADCALFPTEQGCNHEKFALIESDGWIIKDDSKQKDRTTS